MASVILRVSPPTWMLAPGLLNAVSEKTMYRAVLSICSSLGISVHMTTPAGFPPWFLCENAAIFNTSIYHAQSVKLLASWVPLWIRFIVVLADGRAFKPLWIWRICLWQNNSIYHTAWHLSAINSVFVESLRTHGNGLNSETDCIMLICTNLSVFVDLNEFCRPERFNNEVVVCIYSYILSINLGVFIKHLDIFK